MQANLLQVLHAPAHAHGPRAATATETEDGDFSQALTSASDRIDTSLPGTGAAGLAQADTSEADARAEDMADTTAQEDEPAPGTPQAAAAAPSLPAWLADLKGQADRAAAGRPTSMTSAAPDPAALAARAGDAAATVSGQVPQLAARPTLHAVAVATRSRLAPTDAAPAAGGSQVKARGAPEAKAMAPGRAAETLEAVLPATGRSTDRAVAGADKRAGANTGASVVALKPAPGAGSTDHGGMTPLARPEGDAPGANAVTQRLTVAVEGETVTIDLRHARPAPADARAPAPDGARAVSLQGATPPAPAHHRVADAAQRPLDTATASAIQATQTSHPKAAGTRAKAQDEAAPTVAAPATVRTPESATAPARAPENAPAASPQAHVPALASAAQAATAQAATAQAATAPTNAALQGAAPPVPRGRGGPGPLTHGAGDGLRALAANADRARSAASTVAGTADPETAQRLAGSDPGASSAAARASSWMQALEAAVQQATHEAPHGKASDAAASPSLGPVAAESGARPEAAAAESGTLPRIDVAPDSPQFPGMLGARVAAMVRDGVEQARIALNPQELGPVSVQIELAGTQVRVDLAAEVEATRVALEQALPALAGSLREAGFTLAGGGVFQQARDGGSGDPAAGGRHQDGGAPTARAVAAEPVPATRAPRPQGLVDLYA